MYFRTTVLYSKPKNVVLLYSSKSGTATKMWEKRSNFAKIVDIEVAITFDLNYFHDSRCSFISRIRLNYTTFLNDPLLELHMSLGYCSF